MNENITSISQAVDDVADVTPAKVKFRLICASKCKKFALEMAQANPAPTRAKMFTRVKQEFLIACESNLKEFIRNRVKHHPSRGKSLT